MDSFSVLSGKNRRRISGTGKKLKYVDSDSTISSTDIRRERITFKQLQRQGEKISLSLKHQPPSSKWYYRFMKRHRIISAATKKTAEDPVN